MGDAQGFHMVQSCRNTLGIDGSLLNQSKEFAGICDAGACIAAQVTDMKLINDRVSDMVSIVWVHICVPAFRVSGIQIDDHGTLTIDARSSCVWVAGFIFLTVDTDAVCIVYAVQIAFFGCDPCAVCIRSHSDLLDAVICGCQGAHRKPFLFLNNWIIQYSVWTVNRAKKNSCPVRAGALFTNTKRGM